MRNDSLFSLEQVGVLRLQPCTQSFQQAGRLRRGLAHHAGLDDVARVVGRIALAPQRIQNHPDFIRNAQGQRQALNQCLVMAGLARRGPEPTGHHGRECALHHGAVGRVEAGLVTDLGDLRISRVSLCRGQQALHFGGCGVVLLEPADLEQVL